MSDQRYPWLYWLLSVWQTGPAAQARGLYLDEPPWQCHAFTMVETPDEAR